MVIQASKRVIVAYGVISSPFSFLNSLCSLAWNASPSKKITTSNKNSEKVLNEVKEHMLSDNLFSAVKISGTFKNMFDLLQNE
jgi:alpha-acetolactate decarboxylase